MATQINSKTCYATVGNMSRSSNSITLQFLCAKADAEDIYTYFTDGIYYTSVGTSGTGLETFTVFGWFRIDRSALRMRETYAEISLTFDTQNVQGLTNTPGNATRYQPVYSLSTAAEERPIEQHPNFVCMWAYNLYELVPLDGSGSALPAWSTTEKDPAAIHPGYLWAKTPPSSPDADHKYIQVQAATDFGMDSYLIPRPVVTSTIYYKTRNILQSDLIYVARLKAPGQTYIYGNTQTCWLVTGSEVAKASDELLAVTTTYKFCEEGYKTKVYPLAT